jgi:hypothetical protein
MGPCRIAPQLVRFVGCPSLLSLTKPLIVEIYRTVFVQVLDRVGRVASYEGYQKFD